MSEGMELEFIKAYLEAACLEDLVALVLDMSKRPQLQISEHDRLNVEEVMANGDWWSADMLRLIAKSDIMHRMLLSVVFPSHVLAYEDWHSPPDRVDG